ncbi:uncharacterized protein LOC114869692 isoform X2 [Betta splendens]|uniref:Uncharacterized protein LOC114869692 isoform X2 n=1 Tax=Betta splendens TaxID=158456 RepID=A0A9W2X8U1_BETSP|nr:uncharacterized protein LOC114869692 isoform X2 [Betta splendens]
MYKKIKKCYFPAVLLNCMFFLYITLSIELLFSASTECVFSDAKEGRLYTAAEGQTLCFSLANTANATNTEVTLKKDDKYLIFKVKNRLVTLKGEYAQSHSQVVPKITNSGAINLGKATKSHSGKYTLEIFLSNGTLQNKVTVHLNVQAPVSKPNVSQTCLSPEQSVVCCSTEGDGVEFIWSLDNNILEQTRAESTNKPTSEVSNVTISLHGQLTGNLACITQNDISREQTVIQLRSCRAPVSKPEVSQTCLSPEQSVVCCSTEGDGVEFIWSLDDNILIQTRAESTNKPTSEVSNVTISLHGQLTGNLACITQNDISSEQTVIQLRSCKGSIHPPSFTVTVAVIGSVCALLLLRALILYVRHLHKTPRPVAVEDNAEYEIVCYTVTMTPAKERRLYAK